MDEESPIMRSTADGREWYVVAEVSGDAEAQIVAGRLESADIPVWIYRGTTSSAIAVSAGLLGDVEVLVPEKYYDEALDLLESDEVPDSGDDTLRDDEDAVSGEGFE